MIQFNLVQKKLRVHETNKILLVLFIFAYVSHLVPSPLLFRKLGARVGEGAEFTLQGVSNVPWQLKIILRGAEYCCEKS